MWRLMALLLMVAMIGCHHTAARTPREDPQVRTTPQGPAIVTSPSLGVTVLRGQENGLRVTEVDGRWAVTAGEGRFDAGRAVTADPRITLNRFHVPPGMTMVRVLLGPNERSKAFVNAVRATDRGQPPMLVTSDGRAYPAVGWLIWESTWLRVRYTRERPVARLSEVLSDSFPEDRRSVVLLFLVPVGTEVTRFAVKDSVVQVYDPPLRCAD